MEIFVVILFVIIVANLMKRSRESVKAPVVNKDPCPPHKWSYNQNDKHQCIKCNFIAGTHATDTGKYPS
jgi:hypothetical protein